MAITFPAPPSFDQKILGQRLAQIASSPLSGDRGQIVGVSVDRLSYTAPHQNWYSPLDAILAGRLLADAMPTSWRYLLCEGDRGIGEIEVAMRDRSDPSVVIHEGSAAQLSIEALNFSELIPEVVSQDFEARFLKVPALDFTAVWLHRDRHDLIVPVTGCGDTLLSRRAYAEPEVIKALLPRSRNAHTALGAEMGARA